MTDINKLKFKMAYGTSKDIHEMIDKNWIVAGQTTAGRLRDNPAYTREHTDKLLKSQDPVHRYMAFHIGTHITPQDFDNGMKDQYATVKSEILRKSFDPKHFEMAVKSGYGDDITHGQFILGMARMRLSDEHAKHIENLIGAKHPGLVASK